MSCRAAPRLRRQPGAVVRSAQRCARGGLCDVPGYRSELRCGCRSQPSWSPSAERRFAARGARRAWILPGSRRTAGRCGSGFLFAALPGSRVDGRAFIAEAVARGAVAVLAPRGTRHGRRACRRASCWRIPSRGGVWRELAAGLAGEAPGAVVAVTGTNGKTSTVEFLRQILPCGRKRGRELGTLGVVAPGSEL